MPRAVKELKGFAKVFLNPGEKKTVTMELCARDFAYYETKIHDWYTPSGTYEIQCKDCNQQEQNLYRYLLRYR